MRTEMRMRRAMRAQKGRRVRRRKARRVLERRKAAVQQPQEVLQLEVQASQPSPPLPASQRNSSLSTSLAML